MGNEEIYLPPEWINLARKLSSEGGIIVVLGAPDSGKSTLCRYLVSFLSQRRRVALVDGDIGQSTIGPPTTVGVALFNSPPSDFHKVSPLFMRFVGSISPSGHLLQMVVACKKMVERAQESRAEFVIVDTTGMVFGEGARLLKSSKIELLAPRYIIALEKEKEIEHLLKPYLHREGISIFRLPPPPQTRMRSWEERRSYRQRKFQEYFAPSQSVELSLEEMALDYIDEWVGRDGFEGLLAGLNDAYNDTIALAIVEKYTPGSDKISILTPFESLEMVKSVQLSSFKLDLNA